MLTSHSEGGFFKARLTFPEDFPIQPPKLRFITPMWHPNSVYYIVSSVEPVAEFRIVYQDGNVCISILVSYPCARLYTQLTYFVASTR